VRTIRTVFNPDFACSWEWPFESAGAIQQGKLNREWRQYSNASPILQLHATANTTSMCAADVRFGSKADIAARPRDVRFLSSRCLFLTKSRTWREPHVGPFEQIIGLNSQVNSFSAAYLLLCRIIQLAI
jgi:hypothetical protein